MTNFTGNKFKGNRDVTININEQNNIGKPFSQCTNDELFDEQGFREQEKSARARELRKANIKWLVWLLIGILVFAYVLKSVWMEMGQKLDFNYILNVSFNLINVESKFLTTMVKILIPILIPFVLVLLPLKFTIKNLADNDRLYKKHRDALIEIKEILEERGIK